MNEYIEEDEEVNRRIKPWSSATPTFRIIDELN